MRKLSAKMIQKTRKYFLSLKQLFVCGLVAVSVRAQTCAPLPSGIVSWWPANGNALDFVGANNGVAQNGATFTDGEVGQSFQLDGIDDYIAVPSSDSLNVGKGPGFTVEAWINPDDIAGQHPIFEWNANGAYQAHFWISVIPPVATGQGCLYANLFGADGIDHYLSSPGGIIRTGLFQHVALTFDRTTGDCHLYLNGVVVASRNLGNIIPVTTGNVFIGHRPNRPPIDNVPYYFQGRIDEVSLYNRWLAASEIGAIYLAGALGKCQTPTPPVILAQPASQSDFAGDTVTLSVTAGGSGPLNYQWLFNSASLFGATNSTLTLADFESTNAGNYSVLVSNPFGSVTSQAATVSVQPPPPCTQVASGLISWWKGDNDATDLVGGNRGFARNGVLFTGGEVGQAFNFNGSNQFVEIPNSASLNPIGSFSIEAWIYPVVTADQTIFGKWSDSERSYTITTTPGNGLRFGISDLAHQWDPSFHLFDSPTNLVPLNAWSHVAAVYDQSAGKRIIYLNGVEVAERTDPPITVLNGGAEASIGARMLGAASPANLFAGKIDEVSFYGRALLGSEIAAIYNARHSGKCQPQLFTVTAGVIGQGIVTLTPQQLAYVPGTTISVLATASPGYRFLGWGGDLNGSSNSASLLIDTNKNIVAAFVTNAPPDVSLSSPLDGAVFAAPASIALAATASDSDGLVRKVDFYQGATLLGTKTIAPYTLNWTNVPQGNYALIARATDNDGSTTASKPVNITVGPTNSLVLSVGNRLGSQGDEVVTPITVRGFSGINSLQFSMHWDPSVVSFVGVEQFGLTGLGVDNFGTTGAGGGTLRLSWDDASGIGQIRPNDTALFAVRFSLVGTNGTFANVTIDGNPVLIEAINSKGAQIPVLTSSGKIQIQTQTIVHVSGAVNYYQGQQGVEGVILTMTGDSQQTTATSTNGLYDFAVVAGSYAVTPQKTDDDSPNQGVTTADISLIRRQILGIATNLDSPYKLLAADVNGSGSVTTGDIGLIRRLILDNASSAPLGLWRFVRSDAKFPDPNNPWNAEASRNYTNNTSDLPGQDFVAIKLGDVNGSWKPAATGPASIVSGIIHAAAVVPDITFKLGNQMATSGGAVRVPISVTGFAAAATVQFTIAWNSNVWSYVANGDYGLPGLSSENFGIKQNGNGKLTFSWDDAAGSGVTLSDGSVLFTITLTATGAVPSTSQIAFADTPTIREVTAISGAANFVSVNGVLKVVVAPKIGSANFDSASGSFQFVGVGNSGETYLVQNSADLIHWTTVDTVTNTTGTVTITRPRTSGQTQFYRMLIQ